MASWRASAHPSSRIASGRSLRRVQGGGSAGFAVQTWDVRGNVCEPPLSAFDIKIQGLTSKVKLKGHGTCPSFLIWKSYFMVSFVGQSPKSNPAGIEACSVEMSARHGT